MTLAPDRPSTLTLRRLSGRIGAVIENVDASRDLDEATIHEIRAALVQHKAIVFRGQDLDDAAHQRFLARFGRLTTAHPTVSSLEGEPNVLEVKGEEGVRANNWHSDVTFLPAPPSITSLRSLVVPEYGGETLIANTATAYQDLPEPLRELADRLWAVHTNDYDYVVPQFQTEAAAQYRKEFVSTRYETLHPVVRVHPESGERNLFIGGFAQRVQGLSTAESRDVLRLLQAYVIRPENNLRWRWALGDLVLFDNRITQHYAPDDYGDQPRTLHRVTVSGDVPVSVDGSRSRLLQGDSAEHYTPVR